MPPETLRSPGNHTASNVRLLINLAQIVRLFAPLCLPPAKYVSDILRFEHPLHEPARTWLRLEHLFARAQDAAPTTPNSARNRLDRLFEIAEICERPDLRGDLIGRLDEIHASIERFRSNPAVNAASLDKSLAEIRAVSDNLRPDLQSAIRTLRDHPVLASLAQRRSIPGGTCEFDLPELHAWLHQPAARLDAALTDWFDSFTGVQQAVKLILRMVRTSAAPRSVVAPGGYFQDSVDGATNIDLLQVLVDKQCPCYAEVSGNKRRFTIRFMRIPEQEMRATQYLDDVEFQLVECGI